MSDTLPEMIARIASDPFQVRYNCPIYPVGNFGLEVRKIKMANLSHVWLTKAFLAADWAWQEMPDGFLAEPISPCTVGVSAQLFHVTSMTNATAIDAQGFDLRAGGTTWMGRTYTPRVYLAISLVAAFEFLDSKVTGQPSIGGPGVVAAIALNQWEVFETDVVPERSYFPDPWMTGGVWTDVAIAAADVRRVAGWRPLYEAARCIRNRDSVGLTPLP